MKTMFAIVVLTASFGTFASDYCGNCSASPGTVNYTTLEKIKELKAEIANLEDQMVMEIMFQPGGITMENALVALRELYPTAISVEERTMENSFSRNSQQMISVRVPKREFNIEAANQAARVQLNLGRVYYATEAEVNRAAIIY